MPTLGGLTYEVDTFYDTAAGNKTITPPPGCRAILVAIAGTGDPYGTLTFGGVNVPMRIGEGHYGREGAVYSAYAGLAARSSDVLAMSGFSGTLQIVVATIAASDDGGHGGATEYTGWAALTSANTSIDDAVAGDKYQVGIHHLIGEASLGSQTPNWASTGASYAHLGAGGADDTGMAAGLFVQGPGTAALNMNFSSSSDIGARFWTATAGWVPGPASSTRRSRSMCIA